MKHVLVVLAALSILAGPLSAQAERPLRVAVAEFQTKGEATFEDAGRIIPEWLIGSLSRIPEFDVVERVLLDRVLEEQGLALSGLVGEGGTTAGALAGADAVVAGSVIAWAGSLSVTVRLIDATSGEVIRAVTLQDASPKSLPSELDGVARVLAGQQPASALRPRPSRESRPRSTRYRSSRRRRRARRCASSSTVASRTASGRRWPTPS